MNTHIYTWRGLLVSMLTLLSILTAASSNRFFYISTLGSDSSDGLTPSTAWQTIAKVNAASFDPGDEILFRSGDTFLGEIDVHQSGITIGSYGGSGASTSKPVITGGMQLSNWSVYSGSIYVTTASGFVKDLFANGTQMTVARYPNTGFVTVSSTDGSSTISSGGITQPAGYWNGGTLHIRTTNWSYETRPITSYSGGTFTLSGVPEFAFEEGWGFYVDNELAALDAPGEWYCDPATNKVYFYAPNGVNPSTLTVTGSVLNYGVSSQQGNVTVQGVAFTYQASAAIHFEGNASNVQVLSNDVFGQWMHGIEFSGTHANCTIDGNVVQNVNGCGINLNEPQSFTITNNTIKSVGLVVGYGATGVNGMCAIVSQGGGHNTISRNVIDSVGYIGIRHDGSNNLIENNVVSDVMLRLADGGAIYAWGGTGGTYGTTIRGNIIDNAPGDNTCVPNQPTMKSAMGIYFDLGCFNMTTVNNTVIHAGDAAIYIQYSDCGIVVRNNTFYECAANFYSATIDVTQDNSMAHGGNVFSNNIFFPLNNNQPLFRQQQGVPLGALVPIGTLDSNTYYDPYSRGTLFQIVYDDGEWNTAVLTLPQWQSRMGQDAHSKDMTTTLSVDNAKRTMFVNKTSMAQTYPLLQKTYRDLNGASVTGSITLPAYSSRILIGDTAHLAESQSHLAKTQSEPLPRTFALKQNFPNPFNPSTRIGFDIAETRHVTLAIYDALGRKTATLVDGPLNPGSYQASWDASRAAAGIYYCRLTAGSFERDIKLILVK